MLKRTLLALSLLLLASTSFAAELGRTHFNGREIVLSDDNTWRYSDEAAATTPAAPATTTTTTTTTDTAAAGTGSCPADDLARSSVVTMSLCVAHADWDAGEKSGDQEFVFFSKDGLAGAAVVPENVVVTSGQYRSGILTVAAQAAGVGVGQVQVLEESQVEYGGVTWDKMRYQVTIQGTLLEYLNFRRSTQGFGSVQVIFWSLPPDAAAVGQKAETILQSVNFSG
jgi:hypothetical protein